jgi:mannosyltransferase OCH1-like enzyme
VPTIHRIWMGGPMPERYVEYGRLWKELNYDPHLLVHDWTEEEIFDTEWENQEVINDLQKNSQKTGADMVAFYTHLADVVDYELIWKFGGWYFNTDLKPIKPLSALEHDGRTPAFAMEDDVHAVNMAMYGMAYDPLFGSIIEELPKRYFGMPGAFMNATTGVQLIMHVLHLHNGPVKLYPRQVFNPIHWADFGYGQLPDIEREYPEETVAVHEWLHRTNQRGQRVLENG